MSEERERIALAAAARATNGRGLYAYDEDGRTYEVVFAKRESQKFAVGELKLPPTAKAVCVEGDENWTQLPGSMTIAEFKATESKKRKAARIASANKKAAPNAASR